MRPTLRQMEYLVAVAETGTMNEAARMTHVSQPSLSSQLSDMEAYLGAPLIERSRTGATLTPLGKIMVARARIVLSQVRAMRDLAKDSSGSLAGILKLGTLPTVGPYLLPKTVKFLHETYPELKFEVREERTIDLQDDLMSGVLDVIISTPEDHPGTLSMPIVEENIYICVAPDDPLGTSRDPLPLKALKGRELLTLGFGHKFAIVVQNLASRAGAVTRNVYEGTSLDAIRQMAEMGVGVGVLPSLYAISEAKRDPDLRVRRIDHSKANRLICLIWRESSPLEEKFRTIGNHISDIAADIMS